MLKSLLNQLRPYIDKGQSIYKKFKPEFICAGIFFAMLIYFENVDTNGFGFLFFGYIIFAIFFIAYRWCIKLLMKACKDVENKYGHMFNKNGPKKPKPDDYIDI